MVQCHDIHHVSTIGGRYNNVTFNRCNNSHVVRHVLCTAGGRLYDGDDGGVKAVRSGPGSKWS